ncbi:receptor for retinol uptake STRA6 [Amblyraja radiata]|uniref:receptor for retinol uptake STRA6 n=1 Tax=Amblyraja radiata TaxID=386614 RepID=UPI0014039DEC|nr:receptor for retinol uptake STRA6 [Amblyraja radiata]XP_032870731.1 receptor for retinol uptake STRA6 [Amblyraja radiata]
MDSKDEVNYMDYTDWYIDDPVDTALPAELAPCNPIIRVDLFHISAAGASVVVLVFLSFFVKRRWMWRSWCRGAPGLLHPAGLLESDCHRGIAAAVFGVLVCSVCAVAIDSNPLPIGLHYSKETKEYWKIAALLYYPALYYPLLACATVKNKVGYLLGSLLSWLHSGVLIWQKVECPLSQEPYKYYTLLRSLPQFLCLGFLSVVYPVLLLRNGEKSRNSTLHWWQADEYYMDYLRVLLKKRPSKNSARTDQSCISSKVRTLLRSYVYIPMKGFRIPPKLTVSVTVALVTVYQVALLLVVDVVPTLQKMRAGVHEEFSYVLEGFGINLSDKRDEVIRIVKYYFWIVEACYISAITTSCCFTLSMLMRSMVLHRENLLSLYRGDTGKVFNVQRRIRPSQSAIVSWMSFTSYQVAHVALGLSIQLLVFFMCFGLFAFLIVVPILHGRNLFLFKILETMWPFWLALVVVLLIQHVLARFLFLHKDGKTLSITNRRGLYIFTYLFFMFNVLIGSIVAMWRVALTAVYNIIHFCRLDMSLLHRGVECFDPAYRCYVGFLLVEVSHSHPVMKAFCFLLLRSQDLGLSGGDRCKNEEEGIQLMSNLTLAKTARSRRVRARWHLAFTLLRNPILIASRKPDVCPAVDLVSNGELNSSSRHSPDDNLTKSELCEKE